MVPSWAVTKSVVRPSIFSSSGRPLPHVQVLVEMVPISPGPITHEWEGAGRHMCDYNFPGLSWRQGSTIGSDNLNDDIFGADVHSSLGALVGNEASVSTTVSIGYRAVKNRFDPFPLMVVKPLRGHKRNFDTQIIQRDTVLFCILGNQIIDRGVAEKHFGLNLANFIDKFGNALFR